MRHWMLVLAAIAALASSIAGCSCDDPGPRRDGGGADAGGGDGGPIDSGAIDAGAIDAGPIDSGGIDGGPVRVRPTATFESAGGGTASGPGHVVRFSVGAPQPMGTPGGATGEALLGPGAAGR